MSNENRNVTFVVVGPLAGKTFEKNGYYFKNGKCDVFLNAINVETVCRAMEMNNQAFPEGTLKLKEKQKWYQEVALNGKHNTETSSDGDAPNKVQSAVQSDGQRVTQETPITSVEPVTDATGNTGPSTPGDGYKNPWLS